VKYGNNTKPKQDLTIYIYNRASTVIRSSNISK